MAADSRLHVVIVGGGIGGLFAANALIAHGLRVSVYEQAPALGEVGAGVYLTPNSVRHLERVGLGAAVEKWGSRVGTASHYFRHDGAPIAPVQVADSSGWNATFGMHRADFVGFLAAALPAAAVCSSAASAPPPCPPVSGTPATGPPALLSTATSPASASPTARAPRLT